MPRYHYRCSECNIATTVIHGINEMHTQCEFCETEDTMIKLLTKPTILRNYSQINTEHGVGEITNEYIEKNREVLEAEKEKAKKEVYEPS
jgi:hypothetical protein